MTATVIPGSAQSQVGSAQPTRRNTELALLVLVWLIGALALVLASEGAVGEVVADVRTIVIIEGVCLLGIHLVVRWLAPYADPVMLPTAAALNVLGIAMIGRLDIADAKRAAAKGVEIPDSVAVQQAIWMAVGVVACALVLVIVRDHRTLRRYTYLIGLAGLVLLLLPMVPGLGLTIRGANLWIQVGPFTFQPAELAKVLLTIFFASYLVQTRESLSLVRHKVLGLGIPRGRDLGPILVAWAIAMGIVVFQRDLGTAAMFFGLFVGLLYVATGRRSWIILGFLLTVFGAVMAYLAFSHVQIRVKVWLDPFAYSSAEGYQIVESLYGFANGGMMGTGMGPGLPAAGALRRERLHLRGPRRGARDGRGLRHHRAVRDPHRTGAACGARQPGPVRHTAGHRVRDRPGPADLHRARRRHQAHPAHRPDHAVHVGRRVLAAGQLDHPRTAAAGVGPRPAARSGHHPPG